MVVNIQYDETVIYNGMFIPIMSISELYIRNKKYTFYNQDSIVTITDILKPTENITLYTYSDKTIFGIQHETVKHNIKYIARVTFDLVKQPKKAKYTFKTMFSTVICLMSISQLFIRQPKIVFLLLRVLLIC